MKIGETTRQERATILTNFLKNKYSNAKCTLNYINPLELLIATILSAQCTDKRVNIVTRELFAKYKSIQDYAYADIDELMIDIKSTGFYRNKAANIKKLSLELIENRAGNIPETIDDLIKLPGVGRKTANVVLGNCFDKPGVVVDTHVKRIVNRIGLVTSNDPVQIEFEVMDLIQGANWTMWSHQMIAFGREICTAKTPKCGSCYLNNICYFYSTQGV